MAEQRLPIVNSDDGAWGEILNQYISKEHYDNGMDDPVNGSHKYVTLRPGTTAAGTAPLKFSAGPKLSTAESGAIEFNNDRLYITRSDLVRKAFATYNDDGTGATGDIYYRDASGDYTKLGVGSIDQVLTVASGIPAWEDAKTGFIDSVITAIEHILAADDATILADASTSAINVTLPPANTKKDVSYRIKKIDSSMNAVTVVPNGADLIDGNPNMVISYRNSALDIVSNGSSWYII